MEAGGINLLQTHTFYALTLQLQEFVLVRFCVAFSVSIGSTISSSFTNFVNPAQHITDVGLIERTYGALWTTHRVASSSSTRDATRRYDSSLALCRYVVPPLPCHYFCIHPDVTSCAASCRCPRVVPSRRPFYIAHCHV